MLFLSKGENLRGPHSYLPSKEFFFFFFFWVRSETSSWPVMSIVKMEDGGVSAGPSSPGHPSLGLRILSPSHVTFSPLSSLSPPSATADTRSGQKSDRFP